MKQELTALVAAIRAQPWAILPDYLDAIEAIALRALDADILDRIGRDGHIESVASSLSAVASVGTRLEGSVMSTVRGDTAVVPLIGTIYPRASLVNASTDGTSLDAFMRDIRTAQAAANVSRIVMLVDSPGGVVSGLSEGAETLRASTKPIVAFVTGNAASAAYWLASQASEIIIDRAGAVGSIGVVATLSVQETPDQSGRRRHEVVSSSAPNKRPDPMTEEGRATIQQDIDAVEAVFIDDVAAGRGVSAAKVRADFGKGAMLAGERAVAAGMADRLGTLNGLLGQEDTGRTRQHGAGRSARAMADIKTRRLSAEGV